MLLVTDLVESKFGAKTAGSSFLGDEFGMKCQSYK